MTVAKHDPFACKQNFIKVKEVDVVHDCKTTIQHWQLRDLIGFDNTLSPYSDDSQPLLMVHQQSIKAYDPKSRQVPFPQTIILFCF